MNAEPIASLTEREKNDVLRLLGYTFTSPSAAIGLGIPRASQSAFLVMQALNFIPRSMVSQVREWIAILDEIDRKILNAQKRMVATKVGEIDLNPREADMLEGEYVRWAMRLADGLGVPLNQYALRFQGLGGINVPVVHS